MLLQGCGQSISKWPCNPCKSGFNALSVIPAVLELDLLAKNLIVGSLNNACSNKKRPKRGPRPSLGPMHRLSPDHKHVAFDIK